MWNFIKCLLIGHDLDKPKRITLVCGEIVFLHTCKRCGAKKYVYPTIAGR